VKRLLVLILLSLLLILPSLAVEAVKVTEIMTLEGISGPMPVNTLKLEMFFSKDAMKVDTGVALIIVTRRPLKVISCENVTKRCYVTSVTSEDLKSVFPSDNTGLKRINSMILKMKRYMKKIGTKRIGLWTAQGYEINIEEFYKDNPSYKPQNSKVSMKKIVIWTTRDKSCFKAIRKLEEISSAWKGVLGITSSFINLDNPIINDYGYPVKIEGFTDQGKITVTFEEFSFMDVPDSEFQVPQGYRLINFSGSKVNQK